MSSSLKERGWDKVLLWSLKKNNIDLKRGILLGMVLMDSIRLKYFLAHKTKTGREYVQKANGFN